jgi:hypothetical protein
VHCGNDDDDTTDPTPTPVQQANLEITFIPNPVTPVINSSEQRYDWIYTMVISETNGISVDLYLMSWLEESNEQRIIDFFGTSTVPGGGQISNEFVIFKRFDEGGAGGDIEITVHGTDANGNDVSVTSTVTLLDYTG